MSIRSTVSDTPCKNKELPFPKLIQEIRWPKNIALSVSPYIAFQVVGSSPGFHYKNLNLSSWKDFTGSICLENSKDCN